MRNLLNVLASLILCGFCGNALACPQAELVADDGTITRLQQQKYESTYELVLLAGDATQQTLKSRLSYDGTADAACRFGAVAIAQGKPWGWHLAWADAINVYITRMDGEAWVHVPPKRFGFAQVQSLKFEARGDVLQITATNAQGTHVLQSDDEGRSWQTLAQ